MVDSSSQDSSQKTISEELIVALLVALFIPLLLGIFARPAVRWIRMIFFFAILLFPVVIFFRILWDWVQNDLPILDILLRYLRPVPPGAIYGSDLKREGVPWVTLAIILINGLVFLTVPESAKPQYVFLPRGDTTNFEILFSVFTAAFLHANMSHLGFNMLFLWAFGNALEPRLGWRRFTGYYIAAIVGSKALVYLLLVLKAQRIGTPELVDNFHSLGASGAVAGIMGLFVVRCFFARVSMSVPLIMIPFPWLALGFFSFPLRMQAPILIGLFFAFDISGSVAQFHMAAGRINYWSHVGGYLTCMIIGLFWGLHREATGDMIKTKALRYTKEEGRSGDAETNYQKVLTHEPNNVEALSFLFTRCHQRGAAQSGQFFSHLLDAAVTKNMQQAATLCREHLPSYLPHVSPSTAAKLGLFFHHNGELVPARYLLERAASTPGPWQPKTMLMLAKTFIGIGNLNMARRIFEQVMEQFSGSLFASEAEKLMINTKYHGTINHRNQ